MTAPPKRRWFSFGLQTMFVIVVALAVPLGWIAKERAQSQYEHELTDRLRIQGVPVFLFLGPYDSWKLHCEGKPQGRWSELARWAFGERIVYVDAAGSAVKDTSLFAGLSNLQVLNLNGTAVSDLSPLAGLSNLQVLKLGETAVSDLSPLSGHTNLEFLNVTGTAVSDLSPLAGLTNLQVLLFERTKVSNLTPIRELTRLREVRFSRTQISPEQVAVLKQSVPNCEINEPYFSRSRR